MPNQYSIPIPPEERFWKFVNKTDSCWLWTGGKSGDYGMFHLGNNGIRSIKAHRYSYELHNGPIPEGMLVCHKCDNPSCVNPDHLFIGNNIDNMQDCLSKGRFPNEKGIKNPQHKLTEEQVRRIKYSNEDIKKLSTIYEVHRRTIKNIRIGKTWKHIV